MALKQKDKLDFYNLSSKHETAEISESDKKQFNLVLRNQNIQIIIEYNKEMIGIVRQDQMLA